MSGNIPGNGYNYTGELKHNGQGWAVYSKKALGYTNVKLVLLTDVGKKGNFWFSFKMDTKEFVKSANDFKTLVKNYYDLYEQVCSFFDLDVETYEELNK